MPRRKKTPLKLERVLLIALLAGAAVLAFDRWRMSERLGSPEYLASLANELEESRDVRNHSLAVLEQRQLAEAKLIELRERCDTAAVSLNDALAALATADRIKADLQEGSTGKAIAADEEGLAQFWSYQQETPELDAGALTELSTKLVTLRVPIDEAVATENYDKQPDDGLVAELDELFDVSSQAYAEAAEHRDDLTALLARFKTAPRGDRTLAAALAEQEAQLQEAEAARVAEAVAKVREEYADRLANERAETQRRLEEQKLAAEREARETQLALAEAEAEKTRREAELARALAIDEADALAQAAEQARAKAAREAALKQDMGAVRRYLTPFITAGNKVPKRLTQWEYTSQAAPLSLSLVESFGALENDDKGRQAFMWLTASRHNDRPDGPFGSGYFGGAVRPQYHPNIVRAQELIKKHRQALVETGMMLQ